jgi:HYR domain
MKPLAIPLTIVALALTGLAASTANAGRAHTLDTLQLDAVFAVAFHGVDCPSASPVTTYCFLWAGPGTVPGLGQAQESYTAIVDGFGSACAHAHWTWTLTVADKGEIDANMQIPGCANQNSPSNVPATFTITHSTGTYTGATGSGTLTSDPRETGPGIGTSTDTWRGTLNVPGLNFDTTPPTITGAHNLAATAKTAPGARVSYTLNASDPADGNLPVTCRPASGTRFHIGRTTVTCKTTDNDGNTATARFTVTVKRAQG